MTTRVYIWQPRYLSPVCTLPIPILLAHTWTQHPFQCSETPIYYQSNLSWTRDCRSWPISEFRMFRKEAVVRVADKTSFRHFEKLSRVVSFYTSKPCNLSARILSQRPFTTDAITEQAKRSIHILPREDYFRAAVNFVHAPRCCTVWMSRSPFSVTRLNIPCDCAVL